MPKFRKKPVVIEAIQFNGINDDKIISWIHKGMHPAQNSKIMKEYNVLYIRTLEGVMAVTKDDWVIKGINGEFYTCKPEIFGKTYEPA